jgi:hypothetical protein
MFMMLEFYAACAEETVQSETSIPFDEKWNLDRAGEHGLRADASSEDGLGRPMRCSRIKGFPYREHLVAPVEWFEIGSAPKFFGRIR